MPRHKVPKDDVVELANELKANGHLFGAVRYPNGLEVSWGPDNSVKSNLSPLEQWKAKKNAS